ncbi:MAG: DUF4287 domain-containing protein [Planctomycetota bacterium]|nr:MAG: DUF4287 domain-containing protein [Planctomycetota bacterium]
MASTPEEMAAAMIANMKDKTGKTLNQWLKIAEKCGQQKHGQIVKFLKTEHGLTHGYASLVAHKQLASDAGSAEATDLVEQQYAGKKAGLKPIYDALVARIQKFGDDVELSPKKAYVSLRRSKQFGCIQPSTQTRMDLGLKFKDKAPKGRLEAAGSWNSMVSHRVRITGLDQVDEEVIAWLKEAYLEA